MMAVTRVAINLGKKNKKGRGGSVAESGKFPSCRDEWLH